MRIMMTSPGWLRGQNGQRLIWGVIYQLSQNPLPNEQKLDTKSKKMPPPELVCCSRPSRWHERHFHLAMLASSSKEWLATSMKSSSWASCVMIGSLMRLRISVREGRSIVAITISARLLSFSLSLNGICVYYIRKPTWLYLRVDRGGSPKVFVCKYFQGSVRQTQILPHH